MTQRMRKEKKKSERFSAARVGSASMAEVRSTGFVIDGRAETFLYIVTVLHESMSNDAIGN